MIHSHTKGMDTPDDWCKRRGKKGGCKGHFPQPPAEHTYVNEDGWLVYKRGLADRMVVPYNPWLSLYFTSHINVELVASAHIFTYLFKCVPLAIPCLSFPPPEPSAPPALADL